MMLVKFLADEDYVNYKKCSMFIGFPFCTFKCDKENGTRLCQNAFLAAEPNVEITTESVYNRYIDNPLSKAIVIGGLEPFDSFKDLEELIKFFRSHNCLDDIVIYTGYTEEEILNDSEKSEILKFSNLIIKYGRFKPDQPSRFDDILGITLVSPNQYAKMYNFIPS